MGDTGSLATRLRWDYSVQPSVGPHKAQLGGRDSCRLPSGSWVAVRRFWSPAKSPGNARAHRIGGALRLCLALAVSALAASCGDSDNTEYVTSTVAKGDVRDVVPAVGTIKALSQIEVRADSPGRVVEILVDVNVPVRAGQVLARIQPDRLALDVEGARAGLASAEAAATEARARDEQAQRHLANRRHLAERDFISPAALAEAEANARASSAAAARARAEATRAAVQVRSAQGALADVLVRAPSDGFVLSRTIELGQVVTTTSEEPLFVIASNTDRVLIEAQVAEPDISRITPDARVVFGVEAYARERFEGRLREVVRAPHRDRNFVSYPVLIEAENPENKLFPGMTAAVEFIHADARNVLRIPVEAVYFKPENYVPNLPPDLRRKLKRLGLEDPIAADGAEMGRLFATGRQRVFVMTPTGPAMRTIRVGAESAEFLEVVEGLREGEVVVTRRADTAARRSVP